MEKVDQPLRLSTASLADVVLSYPHAMEILHRHNLDYCCEGKTLFVKACKTLAINPENIWEEIHKTLGGPGEKSGIHFENWSTCQLIDFILEHHNRFVRKSIPELQTLLDTLCSIHGEGNITVLAIRDDFNDLAAVLEDHMSGEEGVLFPAIQRILDPHENESNRPSPECNINVLIAAIEQEHRLAGELIKSLRIMTQHYTPPDYACPTYRATYQLLQDFDNDLVQHIHLENNILFRRVRESSAVPARSCRPAE